MFSLHVNMSWVRMRLDLLLIILGVNSIIVYKLYVYLAVMYWIVLLFCVFASLNVYFGYFVFALLSHCSCFGLFNPSLGNHVHHRLLEHFDGGHPEEYKQLAYLRYKKLANVVCLPCVVLVPDDYDMIGSGGDGCCCWCCYYCWWHYCCWLVLLVLCCWLVLVLWCCWVYHCRWLPCCENR